MKPVREECGFFLVHLEESGEESGGTSLRVRTRELRLIKNKQNKTQSNARLRAVIQRVPLVVPAGAKRGLVVGRRWREKKEKGRRGEVVDMMAAMMRGTPIGKTRIMTTA